jgi:2-dehydro-3-deoxyphosphogluconate aldolase / (4S)-4-hydroxy-2-oxoglutarate aldolase
MSFTKSETVKRMCDSGVVVVFRTDQTEKLIDASKAIFDGGLPFIEYTLTMPGALGLIEKAVKEMPEGAVIGAGTVLDAPTARAAILAGAKYIVSPALDPGMVEMGHRYGVPVVPGAYTPTEIMQAMSLGVDVVKIFPVCGGGPGYVAEIVPVFPHLEFMASGGVNAKNCAEYIGAGAKVIAQGGQSLDTEAFNAGDCKKVRKAAENLAAILRKAKCG